MKTEEVLLHLQAIELQTSSGVCHSKEHNRRQRQVCSMLSTLISESLNSFEGTASAKATMCMEATTK